MMWIMEKVGVMPMMDSDVPEEGKEKSDVSSGKGRVTGGSECRVRRRSVEEYVAMLFPKNTASVIY